ncbi:MAG: sensor histidine kinase [Acidimicrobiales bacterium]
MAERATRAELGSVLRRAVHPPLGEGRFWIVQAMVLLIASVHLMVDLNVSFATGAFPAGIPVALLIVPVGYAALRYGLTGAATTALWATLLWLPDLLLPHDQGHVGSDMVNLALVDGVAFFFGRRIETERLAHQRAEHATAERMAVVTRYRQLFEANGSPILVLDDKGVIHDANPAAQALLGKDVVGRAGADVIEGQVPLADQAGRVILLPDGRDYRLDVVFLPAGLGNAAVQVVFEDVTEERSEGRRATRYAALVVRTEEEQRQRLSRELHDEPLQLFLHLARRLETLGEASGVPSAVAAGLSEARHQALEAAARLRTLARDLRPPALDQLGYVAAISSLVADVDEESTLDAKLEVTGTESRLLPEVELGAFRITQEAVRNTLRHAAARQLRVAVAFLPDSLTLTVADDGDGFVPEGFDDLGSGHLGLLGMRERARLLGGRLEVRSIPAHGTVVEASIPIAT